jgi:predicted double-glycine peptidase
MTDIYFAIAVVTLLSTLAGVAAYALARRAPRFVSIPIAVATAALIVWNVAIFRHSLWPAKFLPVTNMIVFADPNPELGSILACVALALMPGRMARRLVLAAPLLCLCFWESFAPLLQKPPPLENRSKNGVFAQTSESSCAAASAATLLTAYGIKTTEPEMATLCLTNHNGTSIRGLYRGLKIKTDSTPWQVEVFTGNLDALSTRQEPVILTVQLQPGPGVDPRFQRDWGWAPNVPHSVVLLRSIGDNRFEVADPSVGREVWDRRALETLWHGQGIGLSRRR